MNDKFKDTTALQPVVPTGDPNVIRTAQHFADLARDGKIVGMAVVAIGPNGEIHAAPVLPVNPVHLHLALGALSALSIDINDAIRQFRQKQTPSPIIKPNGMIR